MVIDSSLTFSPFGRSILKEDYRWDWSLCHGTMIWVAPLITALILIRPTVVSLGVIIGGGIIMSGIALICLPNYPIKVPYFDKRP